MPAGFNAAPFFIGNLALRRNASSFATAEIILASQSESISIAPHVWQKAIAKRMQAHETVVAFFEADLDQTLRFAPTLLLLTEQRVMEFSSTVIEDGDGASEASGQWELGEDWILTCHEKDALGTMVVNRGSERGAFWRYTVAKAASAGAFVLKCNLARKRLLGAAFNPEETADAKCPSCGGAYPSDQDACPQCAAADEDDEKPHYSALVRLWQFARPRATIIALGLVLTLACTAAQLLPPLLTVPLVDKVLIPSSHPAGGQPAEIPWTLLYWCLAGLAGSELLAWVLTWSRNSVLAWASERIAADIRNATYSQLQRLSLEFFGTKRTGDLMTRVSTDSDRICNFISMNVVDFMSDVLMITGTACILIAMNEKLALITLIPIPFVGWLSAWIRDRLKQAFRHGSVIWAEMTSILADTIPGIRVVKAFAQETREIERFQAMNDRVLEVNNRANHLWAFFGPTIDLFTGLGVVIIWAFGSYQIIHDKMTYGVLSAFLVYTYRFYTKLRSISWMVNVMQRTSNSARRIFEVLDHVSTVPEPVKPVHVGRLDGFLEIRNVGFKYGNRTVLRDVNLVIKPGEMIGLVGQSGSGKSTLVNLICRFYDVCDGSILADGNNLRSLPVEEYRRNIGVVLQEPFLFYGTIADNISYGLPKATREEIIEAARAAGAHDFILNLPEGYDSVVGERGQSLSGGERQRISIARALLINPAILILDEATSSVDTETERDIQAALDHLIQGRTTIAIAHRLSTLRKADRLVVMERGRVVEIGSHQELIHAGGAYSRLHDAQKEMAAVLK